MLGHCLRPCCNHIGFRKGILRDLLLLSLFEDGYVTSFCPEPLYLAKKNRYMVPIHIFLLVVSLFFRVMSDDGTEKKSAQETPIANGGEEPLLSRVFAALANRRRRYVLYYLRDHDHAQIDELATQIAAWEQDIPRARVTTEATDRVYTDLVHSHLPKLDDYGLVEYDQRSATVCYTYPPILLDEAIELAATFDKPPEQ